MQVAESRGVYLIGRADPPIEAGTVEGGRGIGHDERFKREFAGPADSRQDAVIGREPNNDECRDLALPQVGFQGRANEGAVDRLPVQPLAVRRQRLLPLLPCSRKQAANCISLLPKP